MNRFGFITMMTVGLAMLPLLFGARVTAAYELTAGSPHIYHIPPGGVPAAAAERTGLVVLKSARYFRVCNHVTANSELVVHYGKGNMFILQSGDCHDFETPKLEIDNVATDEMSVVRGTHHHVPPLVSPF